MGIFSAILDKLRHRGSERGTAQSPSGGSQQQPGAPGSESAIGGAANAGSQAGAPAGTQGAARSGGQAPSQAPLQDVDVEAVLSQMAAQKGGGGNYRTSIVDLLKLLDLDSSLAARKELAEELNVRAGADGSAEQNIALHKAVMRKLAENGGKVPESLRN